MRIAPSAGYGYQQNHQNNGHKYSHEMYPRQRRDFAYRNKSNFRRKSQRYNHHNYTFSPQSSAISYRFLDRMHNSNHSVSQGQGRGVSTDQADRSQVSDESHSNRLLTKPFHFHDIDLNKSNFSFL